MIFCCSQFDDVALFWPWKGICNSTVVALAGCTTYPFILSKFPFLFCHCVYTVTEKQELWTGTLCSITHGLHCDREQEVHGVLCHLWPIVLALWDSCKTGWLWLWSYNILCVCLWQHHCSVSLPLLVCFDVYTTVCCIHTYIIANRLKLMSSDSGCVAALSGWSSVTLQ